MWDIHSLKRERGLTATRIGADDHYCDPDGEVRGIIKSSDGMTVLIHSGKEREIRKRFPDAVSEEGIAAITFSGDGFGGRGAEDILIRLHSLGVTEKFISVSETGLTLYIDGTDEKSAWESALRLYGSKDGFFVR